MKKIKQRLRETIQKCDISFIKNGLVVIGIISVWQAVWNSIGMDKNLASSFMAIGIGFLLLHKPTIKMDSLFDYVKFRK